MSDEREGGAPPVHPAPPGAPACDGGGEVDADAVLRVHRNLRLCESSLYRAHPDCGAVAGDRVRCACGRWFVHVHTSTEGCYWLLVR